MYICCTSKVSKQLYLLLRRHDDRATKTSREGGGQQKGDIFYYLCNSTSVQELHFTREFPSVGPRNARRSLRSALPALGRRFSAAVATSSTTQGSGYPVVRVVKMGQEIRARVGGRESRRWQGGRAGVRDFSGTRVVGTPSYSSISYFTAKGF